MQPYRFKTISEYHKIMGLPVPAHPLVSVIDLESIKQLPDERLAGIDKFSLVFDFYNIALKRNLHAKFKYGQQKYDFDEGIMFFMAPGQVFGIEIDEAGKKLHRPRGWALLIHPDFLWNTSLAKTIKQYQFFGYAVNEALMLSEKEETILNDLIKNLEHEYLSNIDDFSKDVMVSQIELLLNYSNRFYNRQFITRGQTNHDLLIKFDDLLGDYFDRQSGTQEGLPTVGYIADKLNMSPNYLSDMLRHLTGQNAQQHIHNKLIEQAKEALSTTSLSVSEISHRLGFEHPQSFNKLFKNKTNVSPLKFRSSFR
ncbi:MAG: helix-turn-helix transcriptional regulator [Nostoc sp.]|uniref:helix-turn-helix domain-containing protein n=1 Tax=Nostoc sp. TaxID=1180 RepID=UPI002FF78D59